MNDKLENEIWLPVKGFEGWYEVSNTGSVRGLDRVLNNGKSDYIYPGKVLKTKIASSGYVHISLSKNMKEKWFGVHRLVALSFINNPNNLPIVNHINGIKNDNRVENLEWVTHSENTKHAVKIGLKKGVMGEKSHYAKLRESDIIEIRSLYGTITQREIAKKFDVTYQQINKIVKRQNWNHI